MSNSTDKARHWFMADAAMMFKAKFRRICEALNATTRDDIDLVLGRLWRLWAYCELHQVRRFENMEDLLYATEIPAPFVNALIEAKWIRVSREGGLEVRMWQTVAEQRGQRKRASEHLQTNSPTNSPTRAAAGSSDPEGSPVRRPPKADAKGDPTPRTPYVGPSREGVLEGEERAAALQRLREQTATLKPAKPTLQP